MSFVNRSKIDRILAGTAQILKSATGGVLGPFIATIVDGDFVLTGIEEYIDRRRRQGLYGPIVVIPEVDYNFPGYQGD